MQLPLIFSDFEGGWSTDKKVGPAHSFVYSQSMDFRKSPSQITVLPGTSREDGGVVTDLVQNEVMLPDGTMYSIGSSGKVYKRTTAGVWSMEAQHSVGTFGLDYRQDADALYMTGNTTVSAFFKMTTTPTFQAGYYASSYSTYDNSTQAGFNVSAYETNGTQTYTPPTSISEGGTNLRYFQSDIEPLQKIGINIQNQGTGDWTLTLHDGLNNSLGSVTIANANLIKGINYFTFSSPVRAYVKPNSRTYHVHVTSTVADGTLYCATANDLSTCDLQVWANRLIQTTNGMHPMIRFQQFECIGNANYLSVWEPLSDPPTNDEWQRHKLVFPSEYEVCGLAVFNEFLAIALEKVTSSSTSTPQEGLLAFWDGTAEAYNYIIKIPEGSPYALHEYKNAIYYTTGGNWYVIGSPTSTPVKLRMLPGTDTEYSGTSSPIKVYPYSVAVRRGIHLMGWPSTTTNTSINFGVYSWGAVDKNYQDSFGYSYIISTGTKNYTSQNNLTIGMVRNFGDTLHISWRDDLNGGYGVDVVNNSSAPATTSSWESLIFDNGYPAKRKNAMFIACSFLSLPSDCTFTLKYKIDRAANWTSSDTYSTTTPASNSFNATAGWARSDIPGGLEYHEIQIGIDVTSGTTTPTFTSIMLMFDDNRDDMWL